MGSGRGIDAAALEYPRDDRIRIPTSRLWRADRAPRQGRARTLPIEHPVCTRIRAQANRAFDGLGDVGYDAVAPAAHLVAEEPQTPGPAIADGASSDDSALGAVAVRDRCLLDHEASLRHAHLERGVVEVADRVDGGSTPSRLEDAAVEADEVSARAERQPVEVDRGGLRGGVWDADLGRSAARWLGTNHRPVEVHARCHAASFASRSRRTSGLTGCSLRRTTSCAGRALISPAPARDEPRRSLLRARAAAVVTRWRDSHANQGRSARAVPCTQPASRVRDHDRRERRRRLAVDR